MRRVFIAINLPDKDKKRITALIAKLKPLFKPSQLRWLSPDNWHVTVFFLGYQDDDAVAKIAGVLKRVAAAMPAPPVEIKRLVYGPTDGTARMVWLAGNQESSKAIGALKEKLEKELSQSGVRFKREARQFMSHITLARFNEPISDRPPIEQEFKMDFTPETIELMESELHRSGAEYSILVSAPFTG